MPRLYATQEDKRIAQSDHQGPLPCTKDKIRDILCCQCNHDIRQGSREDAVRLRAQMQYVESFL